MSDGIRKTPVFTDKPPEEVRFGAKPQPKGGAAREPVAFGERERTPVASRVAPSTARPAGPKARAASLDAPATRGASPSPRQAASPVAHPVVRVEPVTQTVIYRTAIEPGAGWWRRIPGRLVMAAIVVATPLRALVMILDALVAASVLAVIAICWAWWNHYITDDQVAQVLAQIGGRGLSILSKSGII